MAALGTNYAVECTSGYKAGEKRAAGKAYI